MANFQILVILNLGLVTFLRKNDEQINVNCVFFFSLSR